MFAFIKLLVFSTGFFLPGMLAAQPSPADDARAAAKMLEAASAQLEEAQGSRNRVRALTTTILAFEEGLSALRSGMRHAAKREAELAEELHSEEDEIAALLAVLLRIGAQGTPVVLLHPGGPTGTVRAGMMLSDLVPALNESAQDIRNDFEELKQLQTLQKDASEQLVSGLRQLQSVRSELSEAIAERQELPKRFVADPVREAILLSSVETLEGFAEGLDQISEIMDPLAPGSSPELKGSTELPVQGTVLRAFGEVDAAGIARPGIIIETFPKALVTNPVASSMRYVGPLLDFGLVVILEPSADLLFVLAGMETAYVETGDIVEAGAPLGLMGDAQDKSLDQVSTDSDETGTSRSETLYIEVRQNNTPEDPSLWFLTDKDG